MNTSLDNVRRSGVYYLMCPIAPINAARSAKRDIWGAAIVVALLLGGVSLMRVILAA